MSFRTLQSVQKVGHNVNKSAVLAVFLAPSLRHSQDILFISQTEADSIHSYNTV